MGGASVAVLVPTKLLEPLYSLMGKILIVLGVILVLVNFTMPGRLFAMFFPGGFITIGILTILLGVGLIYFGKFVKKHI